MNINMMRRACSDLGTKVLRHCSGLLSNNARSSTNCRIVFRTAGGGWHHRSHLIDLNRQSLIETLGFDEYKLDTMYLTKNWIDVLSLDKGVLEARADRIRKRLGLSDTQLKKITQQQPYILSIPLDSDNGLEQKIDYMQNRLLLDDEALRNFVIHIPRVLLISKDDLGSKLDWLHEVLMFDGKESAKVINKYPDIVLRLDIGILNERVGWLKKCLNLMNKEIKKIILSQPTILGITGLESKFDYLQNRLLLDKKSLAKITTRFPPIITYSIDDNIEPTLDWIHEQLQLDEASLSKLIQSMPSILSLSIADNIEPTIDWIQQRLHLDDTALSKLIRRLPPILGMSIPDNMEPTLDWLQQRLTLADTALSKLIQRMPSILGMSITADNIEPTLDWLQQRLELDDVALSKVILLNPSILGNSISDNMEPKLDWLQQHLSLTDEEVSNMIQKQPALFGYNIPNNLEPTLDFYIDALGDENEALALVTRNPSALSRSLEKRLKPRLEEAQRVGIVIDYTCLHHIIFYTHDKWDKKINIY